MNAIRITQEIKDKNTNNFIVNAAVNDVVARPNFPNRFYVTENVIGGYANRVDLHFNDGWKPVITPAYDPATEKLGALTETGDNLNFIYQVEPLSAEELEALAEADAEEKTSFEVDQGVQLIKDGRRRLERKERQGVINANQKDKIGRAYKLGFNNLVFGFWKFAQEDLLTDDLATYERYNSLANMYADFANQIQDKVYRVNIDQDLSFYTYNGGATGTAADYTELNNTKTKQATEIDWLQRKINTFINDNA